MRLLLKATSALTSGNCFASHSLYGSTAGVVVVALVESQFGNGLAVFAGIAGPIVHPRRKVAHYHLAAANHTGKGALNVDFVPAGCQFLADLSRETVFHHYVA